VGSDNLPMLLALVLSSITSGILITLFGYYTPAVWLSTVLMTIGAGLMSTFTPNTGHAKWIGYQILYGFGLGCGTQGPVMAAQTVLELKDVPIGTSIQVFTQTLVRPFDPSLQIALLLAG
jgi:MFS family permease